MKKGCAAWRNPFFISGNYNSIDHLVDTRAYHTHIKVPFDRIGDRISLKVIIDRGN